jgi:hypothetical protein
MPAKSKKQARLFGAIAGGADPYSKSAQSLSKAKAKEMLKGTKMSKLPLKKKKKK